MQVIGLVVLTLLAWPRPDAGQRRTPELEVPGAIEVAQVPEGLEALGMPVRLRAVRSSKSEDVLYHHFVTRFRAAGLYLPPPGSLTPPPGMSYLVGIDPESRVTYVLLFQRNQDRTITVIQGEAHVADQVAQARQEEFVPLFPGAEHTLRSRQEGVRSLSFTAPELPPKVWAFYREVLGRAGYREAEDGLFVGGAARLRIDVRQSGPALSHVRITEEGL